MIDRPASNGSRSMETEDDMIDHPASNGSRSMETEDHMIDRPASNGSRSVDENNVMCNPDDDPNTMDRDMKINGTTLELNKCEVQSDNGNTIQEIERHSNLVNSSSTTSNGLLNKDIVMNGTKLGPAEGEFQPSKSNSLPENMVEGSSEVLARVEVAVTATVAQRSHHTHSEVLAGNSLSGVKRARVKYLEQQPKVLVIYNSLSRASKRKLEELMQQWSEWHALHELASQDPAELTESGEETYFPALRTGLQTCGTVSFCMDSGQIKEQETGLISSDANSVPLYDRGYAKGLISSDGPTNIEGGLEILDDAARCFNCGSYSHSLRECVKPRDNVAVKNAREQFKSKRNQSASSRNPTRYYQSTPGGKYDGLRPGALDPETRKLLGIGEYDPPPWLNRMREIGYPPGYLDLDDEDQPSGIIFYDDGESKVEHEDGEILEASSPKKQKKMTVEFPGVNAPIPENADKRCWGTGSSGVDSSRDHSRRRLDHSLDSSSRGQSEYRSWESRNERPPGPDAVFSPSACSYPPRYGGYMSSHLSDDSWDDLSRARSPPHMRSSYDTWHGSPLRYDEFVNHGSERSRSPNRYSSRYENQIEDRHDRRRPHHRWYK